MKRIWMSLAAGAALFPAGAFAATYSMSGLSFATEDQSVWGPGAALTLGDTAFVGLNLDGGINIGEIKGGTTTSYPLYGVAKAAWDTCIALPTPNSWCGSAPNKSSYKVVTDTRNGVKIDMKTEGRIGFDLNYDLSAGSMDAAVSYGVEADLPPDTAIKAGEAFSLTTRSLLEGGTISSESATFDLSVDAVLQAKASGSVTGCVWSQGCASVSKTFLDIDQDAEIVAVTPSTITYLDGVLPDGDEIVEPFGKLTTDFQVGFSGPVPVVKATITDKDGNKKKIEPTIDVGIYADVGSIGVQIPQFSETGGLVGDKLELSARSDFVDAKLDLDTLFGIPGGATLSLGAAGLSATLALNAYDFKAGPSLDVWQDLKMTPELMVTLDFSKEVEIGGVKKMQYTGLWDSLPDFTIFSETVFTPTFTVAAMLDSATGLQFGLEAVVEMLKAELSVDFLGFDLFSDTLGPVFSKDFAFDPDFGRVSVFDDRFAVTGFNSFLGEAFTLAPYSPPAPVPLPPAFALMGIGLAGLGGLKGMRRHHA